MKRQTGILMPVSSLPGRHGIGDFGSNGYEFVDMLAEAGVKVWQILPLGPLGYGNSPYQPYSSFAGDEIFINLDRLEQEGLIDKVPVFQKFAERVDYEGVRSFKGQWLRKAFRKFKPNEEYEAFIQQEWVRAYAIFLTFKKRNGMACWLDWPEHLKNYWKDPFNLLQYENDIRYEMFVQYEFHHQWKTLKGYANSKGIQIMGDIPFYVGIDSLDVWMNQDSFLLYDDGRPEWIAGVPPDYFSETGQRWGNPIYDWEHLQKTGYQFWLDRLAHTASLYDVIRIDHFRAFDTYWQIPESCPTAVEGSWEEAPGYDFFDTLFRKYPDINIIVEDLGDLREEVHTLRDHYGFMGMKVLQFNFNPLDKSYVFPDRENMIYYTGSHDNQTLMGWYKDQTEKFRRKALQELRKSGFEQGRVYERFIGFVLHSMADLAVVPAWDVLGLGDEARVNCPGTVGSPNWEWKMKTFTGFQKMLPWLAEQIKESGRV